MSEPTVRDAWAHTFALIPGAASGPEYWRPLSDELTSRGHRVIAVDLPCDDETCGLAEYASVARGAVGSAENVVVGAHSLGGFTAPTLCEGIDADLLVLVQAMVPAPGE